MRLLLLVIALISVGALFFLAIQADTSMSTCQLTHSDDVCYYTLR